MRTKVTNYFEKEEQKSYGKLNEKGQLKPHSLTYDPVKELNFSSICALTLKFMKWDFIVSCSSFQISTPRLTEMLQGLICVKRSSLCQYHLLLAVLISTTRGQCSHIIKIRHKHNSEDEFKVLYYVFF